ncbi:MAG TPA: fructose-6-phosphate aldolase [archaeon]|nr:fructose-6-phosphate aldolase [archaeon]
MKFFIDSADVKEIREASSWGIVDGVTTNPSLVAKTGRDFKEVIKEIVSIVDGPISAEVVATDFNKIVEEGRKLAKIHDNIVVKVPMIKDGLKAIKEFSNTGIKTNCTLIFSSTQALMAAKAGATYLSPFVGRLDDIGCNGMKLIQECVAMKQNYPNLKSEILVASIRHPLHVIESLEMGADVATLPFSVMEQLMKHPLTDKGLSKFLEDAKKANIQI